jgi:hypothetical protein
MIRGAEVRELQSRFQVHGAFTWLSFVDLPVDLEADRLPPFAEVAQHVATSTPYMGMWELLALSKKLKVDPDNMIRTTERQEHELSRYSIELAAGRRRMADDGAARDFWRLQQVYPSRPSLRTT